MQPVTCDWKYKEAPDLAPTIPDLFLQISHLQVPPALLHVYTKVKELSAPRRWSMDDGKQSTVPELPLARESV